MAGVCGALHALRYTGSSQIKQRRDKGIKCVSITGKIFHLPPCHNDTV